MNDALTKKGNLLKISVTFILDEASFSFIFRNLKG